MEHILLIGTLSALTNVASTTLETIEITGQYSSHVIEETLSVTANVAPDMRDQMAQLPGLSVNSNGQISGIMQYRGMHGERVRVNINGAEVVGAGPNGMDPPLSHVMGVPYQQVTLYRGIVPVSVGAEVLSGAISIKDVATDFAQTAQWSSQGVATIKMASHGVRSVGGLWYASNDKGSLGIKGDYQKGDNVIAGDGRTVPSTFYERSALQLRTGLNKGAHQFDAVIAHRDTNAAGTPALNMDILFVDATWFRLRHEYTANVGWQWQTTLFGNENTHDMDNYSLRQAPPPNRQRLNQTESSAIGLESNIVLETLGGELLLGVNASQRSHSSYISNPNNPMFFIDNFNNIKRTLASIFVEHQMTLSTGELKLGSRLTNVRQTANSIGSNMAMTNASVNSLQNSFNQSDRELDFTLVDITAHWHKTLNRTWKVLASTGIKQRAPTYSELYTWFPLGISGGLADGNNYIGNLALKHETAQKIDLGLQYQSKQSTVSLHVFYDRIRDYITGLPSSVIAANNIAMMNNNEPPLQWQNTQTVLKGIEIEGNYQIAQRWQLNGVAEYVRGIQLGESDKDLYRIAPLNLRLELKYDNSQWQWRVDTQYVAQQKRVALLQNETPSDSYLVTDMYLTFFLSPTFQINFAMNNLFDEYYTDHLGSVNRVMNSDIAEGERLPSSGRNFAMSVMYQF